jgi:mannose/fructose-specific phosphotransferase system component IIA
MIERKNFMSKKYYLISHNEYASGIKKAVEMIAGPQENLKALCLMPGNHPDTVIETIERELTPNDEVVIMGDIAGGSMCNAAMRLSMLPNVVLVAGTNLPLALEVILAGATDQSTIQMIVENAKAGIKILTLDQDVSDDETELFG